MKWAQRVAAGLAVAAVLVPGTATQADDKPMMIVLVGFGAGPASPATW